MCLAMLLVGVQPEEMRSLSRQQCSVFTAGFSAATTWKQPESLSADEWTSKPEHTHTGIFSHKKEGNPLVCDSMDDPGGNCAA